MFNQFEERLFLAGTTGYPRLQKEGRIRPLLGLRRESRDCGSEGYRNYGTIRGRLRRTW